MIDLHTHSSASDGTDSPAALVRKAAALGISDLALTDHDGIDGLMEAEDEARKVGINLVRGCEISTSTPLGEVHILGLWLPRASERLVAFLAELREGRLERNKAILKKLAAHGMKIEPEELPCQLASVGRPHLAKLLVDKGYVKDQGEAFRVWLGDNGKAFAPHPSPSPKTAARILADESASVVFAHPLLRRWPLEEIERFTAELEPAGLAALEAWHSCHTSAQAQALVNIAKKYNLALSGGSDYHGLAKPRIALGQGANYQPIPRRALDSLLAHRVANGLPV